MEIDFKDVNSAFIILPDTGEYAEPVDIIYYNNIEIWPNTSPYFYAFDLYDGYNGDKYTGNLTSGADYGTVTNIWNTPNDDIETGEEKYVEFMEITSDTVYVDTTNEYCLWSKTLISSGKPIKLDITISFDVVLTLGLSDSFMTNNVSPLSEFYSFVDSEGTLTVEYTSPNNSTSTIYNNEEYSLNAYVHKDQYNALSDFRVATTSCSINICPDTEYSATGIHKFKLKILNEITRLSIGGFQEINPGIISTSKISNLKIKVNS